MPEMRQISFSDFLIERKEKFEPDNKCLFKLDKIEKIDFSHGSIHLSKYKPTKTKQIIVEPDDFVFSGLNIEKGAVAINETGKRLVVSANYSTCAVDYSKINKSFLVYFMRSQNFKALLIDSLKKDYGFTRPKHLMPLTFAVPSSLDKQKFVIAKFQRHESEGRGLAVELTHQQTLLKKLRQQILQEAIEGKLTAKWREQHKLSPCKGGVPQSGEGVKKLNNLPHLKTFRKSLRKNLTAAEAKLWTLLKGKQLEGRKFRRQHSIANYILDFYCPAEKLAIELDGEVHNNQQAAEYDRERDLFLAHTGIQVLRFENKVVFQNPEGLLERVREEFNPSAPTGHLPLSGEEFETASVLLARIQVEKAQLIKDKKIKKQKPLPPISEDEKPFALPDGWAWCRLGDISNLLNGYAFKSEWFTKKGVKLVRNANVFHGVLNWSEVAFISHQMSDEYKKFLLKEGDIVLSLDRPIISTGLKAARIQEVDLPCLLLQRVLLIKSIFIYDDYIFKWIFSELFLRSINPGRSMGVPHVSHNEVMSAPFPLPPLPEQKAIVAKVEKLLAVCDELETQITRNQSHANALMQAVLKEAFTSNTDQTSEVVEEALTNA